MTASPGDGEHAAREGYYPDPSIPGYIRYWNGAAWVPGTSRPAPAAPAPAPTPVPVPAPAPVRPLPAPAPVAAPAVRADETGPVFLDETSMTETLPEPAPAPEPEPAAAQAPAPVWQADPVHQAGFGGPRDRRVSWGSPQEPEAEPEAAPAHAAAPGPAPAPAAEPEPGQPSARPAGISLARTPSAAAAPARLPAQSSAGILSARSPAAQAPAAPAAPAWPDAPGTGGPGPTGVTSAWPEAAPAPARTPASAPASASAPERAAAPERADAPAPARPEVWEPRPAGVRPKVPQPAADAAPAEPKPGSWEPRGAEEARTGARTGRPATPRAVFERMAERAVRPAGLVRRTLARALDSLVFGAVAAAVARPLLPGAAAHVQAKVDAARASGRTTTVWLLDSTIAGSLGLVFAAVLLFGLLYEVLPTARWGRTPGKKLLGVRVLATATLRPPSFGAALCRWLVYAFLGLPGSLWCLVNRPRRQAWHDKAAKTYVAR
ncbi:RDD family protein [Streptomyces erythrochromogenes]|uniref:RDD family protein n=1 Tax=Streptomyces erythrochromogenes TaxID=285574 RepID=A0ABZ1QEZ3_9ACTN|nr:RDD family protein [Streptomyces erythrochromogenes]